MTDLAAARTFIYRNGRVLDRRLYGCMFEGADPAGVVDAVRAYRNKDGGFGHGLEPDKRVPTSTPLDTETAFEAMDMAGLPDPDLVRGACDFLTASADATGLVPLVFDDMVDYPHAEHWDQIPRTPGVNPTAGLVALLWKWDVDHPWRDAATAGIWKVVDDAIPAEAHDLLETLHVLERQPDRGRVEALVPRITETLPEVGLLQLTPTPGEYGVTPLQIAPEPDSYWRRLFPTSTIDAFLDALEEQQQPDGGWPITWVPPGEGAVYEWRAWRTIDALRVLRAAGRLFG
jgi:hypothetical protein